MSFPDIVIVSAEQVICLPHLLIPSYQRPYTWKPKNVTELLDDILTAAQKEPQHNYRLGSVILHRENNNRLNIVDGQQRLTTLSIVYYFFGKTTVPLLNSEYSHELSKLNIILSYDAIRLWMDGLDQKTKNTFRSFLTNKCEFVKITLDSLSEAFQFFDAQNARGKALDPADLLKAFHLRAMHLPGQQDEKMACVANWEAAVDRGILNSLLGTYLFRIRRWSAGKPAYQFSKADIAEFKGVNIEDTPKYPYLASYIICSDRTDRNDAKYPHQLNQAIINGENFFSMITHYSNLLTNLFNGDISEDFKEFHDLNTKYIGAKRNGDQYVKRMYKALILLYFDRFGLSDFNAVYPYLYLWSYRLRVQKGSVRYASIDSYILTNNIFQRLNGVVNPLLLIALRNELAISANKLERDIPEVKAVFEKYRLITQ